jgi:hypothetical protein
MGSIKNAPPLSSPLLELSLDVRVSFSGTPAPILKKFWPKALMKTLSSYLFLDYLGLTLGLSD